MHPAGAYQSEVNACLYITDVDVIDGDTEDIQAPKGFYKIPVDLNLGACGKFIFVCYKKGEKSDAITDLKVRCHVIDKAVLTNTTSCNIRILIFVRGRLLNCPLV